jgi:hypothetical protein
METLQHFPRCGNGNVTGPVFAFCGERAGRAVARSVFTHKGVSRSLSAEIVPARTPGVISVRTTVPKTAAVTVSISPAPGSRQ